MAPKKIEKQFNDPCGCTHTTYTDKSRDVFPCLGHALINAGQMLNAAGQRWAQIQNASVQKGKKAKN